MDILNLVNAGGGAQVKVELTSYDLMKFAEDLIKRAMDEQRALDAARMLHSQSNGPGNGERYLTTDETARMCNVCKTTLHNWAKEGFLVPSKIGRSKRYALSDIESVLAGHSVDESKAKLGTVPMNRVQQELARKEAIAGL